MDGHFTETFAASEDFLGALGAFWDCSGRVWEQFGGHAGIVRASWNVFQDVRQHLREALRLVRAVWAS